MNTSPKIIFFGTESFSLAALTALIEAEYDIVAVVTKPDSKKGRGHHLTSPEVKQLAEKHNIPVWQPEKLSDIADDITRLQPVAGVLVSFGKIIPASIISLFQPGVINVHPSLLPRYRGPSPIEAAILGGDSETGVTIMQLSAAMDAGPIYTQITIPLAGNETQQTLEHTLAQSGSRLLIDALPKILSGSLATTEQIHAQASYCHLLTKADGVIDWRDSAEAIERQVRAYSTWPQCRTTLGSIDVIIIKAHVDATHGTPGAVYIDEATDTLIVHAADHALSIDAIKPLGKKEMPIQAFLVGYGSRLSLH